MVLLQGYAGSAVKGLAAAIVKGSAATLLKSISFALAGGAGVVAIVAAAMVFSQVQDLDSPDVPQQQEPES
ncbi:MAG TPA: hypothetical protein VMW23_01595 [Sedimentisphaerales bacterium]|nr:hypothetical protein [Sedimentisphaerales bacterium]